MLKLLEPAVPTADDARVARESSQMLARHLTPGHDLRVRFLDNGEPGEELVLPEKVGRLVEFILGQLARGNAVQVYPLGAELTTQQAADFLNVSRPFVIKQLEAGALAYRLVGTHRRIALRDLIEYRRSLDVGRDAALDELAQLTQELGEDD